MNLPITKQAKERLRAIAQSGEDGRVIRRAQGLVWLAEGEPVNRVAKRLGVSRQMLYVLLEHYEKRKHLPVIERIMDSEHSGRPAHKRELVLSELKVLLLQPPSEYGYRAQHWTVGMLRKQVERNHQIEISDDTVQRALADCAIAVNAHVRS